MTPGTFISKAISNDENSVVLTNTDSVALFTAVIRAYLNSQRDVHIFVMTILFT